MIFKVCASQNYLSPTWLPRRLQEPPERFQEPPIAFQDAFSTDPRTSKTIPIASKTPPIASKTVLYWFKLAPESSPSIPQTRSCAPQRSLSKKKKSMDLLLRPRFCTKGGLAVVRPRRASSIRQTTLVSQGRVQDRKQNLSSSKSLVRG